MEDLKLATPDYKKAPFYHSAGVLSGLSQDICIDIQASVSFVKGLTQSFMRNIQMFQVPIVSRPPGEGGKIQMPWVGQST